MSSKPELLKYTQEDRVNILKHYNRTPESVQVDIETLRNWLDAQPHLPKNIFTDKRIECFLILNKLSIERAKSKMDMYCSIRRLLPDLYGNTQPHLPHMKEIAQVVSWLPLPGLTKDLYRPLLFTINDKNSDRFDPLLMFAHIFNVTEVRLDHDMMIGEVNIWDLKNATTGHIAKISPVAIKKALAVLEKVFSERINGSHFINCGPFMDKFLALVKSVMKPKLAARVHVHKSLESLYEHIPRDLLPEEYGGREESLIILKDKWDQALEEYRPWFETLKAMEVDESLRPGKPLDDDFLGFHGNFRQLDVD